jgi:ribonuclease VapC
VAEPALLLDASALLALVFREPGHERAFEALQGAAISAVNQAELVEVAARRGIPPAEAAGWAEALGVAVLPFTAPMAARAGALLAEARRTGLSLADAACLGTAAALGLPVLTADRAWSALGLAIDIRQLR